MLNVRDAELTQHRDELATTLQDLKRLKSTAPLAKRAGETVISACQRSLCRKKDLP